MDKIQSAIAKARADRAAARSQDNAVAPAATVAAPAPTAGSAQQHTTRVASRILTTYPDEALAVALASRWQTIPTFSPAPALMARNHIATFTGGPESVHFDVMRTRADLWKVDTGAQSRVFSGTAAQPSDAAAGDGPAPPLAGADAWPAQPEPFRPCAGGD
jgi:hypothetical protein